MVTKITTLRVHDSNPDPLADSKDTTFNLAVAEPVTGDAIIERLKALGKFGPDVGCSDVISEVIHEDAVWEILWFDNVSIYSVNRIQPRKNREVGQ